MTTRILALFCAFSAIASAQLTDYLGPGILTRGAGNIGQRSGQDVDLRIFAGATGIYDTGIVPISVDSTGEIVRPDGLYGVEANLGVYGRHQFRRSLLGLDYRGNYRHYQSNTYFNGSNHQLALGYTHQKSQRLLFDFQAVAGTTNLGTNFAAAQAYDTVVDQNLLLFDNRTNYLQGGMDTNYLLDSRTMITVGGAGYTVQRQSGSLIGVNGYDLRGGINRRLSQVTTIGIGYQHTHYDFSRAFGESDIDAVHFTFARQFGRSWTLNLRAGGFLVETLGLQRVSVDPAITKLLGITETIQTFYRRNLVPSGSINLVHNFRNASWNASYSRGFSPGNGVYLTSRQETAGTGFSYTGIRKWSFSVNASYSSLNSVGQDLQRFSGYFGNANVTYALTEALHLTGEFAVRHQDVGNNTFRRTSTRTGIGIAFSPGDIPISFH